MGTVRHVTNHAKKSPGVSDAFSLCLRILRQPFLPLLFMKTFIFLLKNNAHQSKAFYKLSFPTHFILPIRCG